jgi:hypothetical protein
MVARPHPTRPRVSPCKRSTSGGHRPCQSTEPLWRYAVIHSNFSDPTLERREPLKRSSMLDASSEPMAGPARSRLLLIPIHGVGGGVTGGFWRCTPFQWLHVQMLFVPEPLLRRGFGARLMACAEAVAGAQDCGDVLVDTFSFQAAPVYQKISLTSFGTLDNDSPGHHRLYFRKHSGRSLMEPG